MKENKYDNDVFFKKYQEMNRSKYGLQGAGEWSAFQKMLPSFAGKTVLDLGCGYGWHCEYAAMQSAKNVIGIDISRKMLEVAQKEHHRDNIMYVEKAMEDIDYPSESFDVVISSLAFHYIEDFETLVSNIHSWLVPQGDFVFSLEHPVFTAYGTQDWYYDEQGNALHFPVDNYYYEGKRDAVFLGEHVRKYHRTLTSYLHTLFAHGFTILDVIEAKPPEEMMDIPGMKDEMRRPMILLIKACKK